MNVLKLKNNPQTIRLHNMDFPFNFLAAILYRKFNKD